MDELKGPPWGGSPEIRRLTGEGAFSIGRKPKHKGSKLTEDERITIQGCLRIMEEQRKVPRNEKNHEFFRYCIPKGVSFDGLTQKDVSEIFLNINNYARESLKWKTPYEALVGRYPIGLVETLGLVPIPGKDADTTMKRHAPQVAIPKDAGHLFLMPNIDKNLRKHSVSVTEHGNQYGKGARSVDVAPIRHSHNNVLSPSICKLINRVNKTR